MQLHLQLRIFVDDLRHVHVQLVHLLVFQLELLAGLIQLPHQVVQHQRRRGLGHGGLGAASLDHLVASFVVEHRDLLLLLREEFQLVGLDVLVDYAQGGVRVLVLRVLVLLPTLVHEVVVAKQIAILRRAVGPLRLD